MSKANHGESGDVHAADVSAGSEDIPNVEERAPSIIEEISSELRQRRGVQLLRDLAITHSHALESEHIQDAPPKSTSKNTGNITGLTRHQLLVALARRNGWQQPHE